MSTKYKSDLKLRIYTFVLSLLRELRSIKTDIISRSMIQQLVRSSTSILANFVEGQSSVSRKELAQFTSISLKSANETKVWLKLLLDLDYLTHKRYQSLISEVGELSSMLAASVITLKKSMA